MFVAGVEGALDTEIMKSDVAEKTFERVRVRILSDPMVMLGLIEFFIEQSIVTLAVINCAGKKHFQSICKSIAIGDAAFVSIETGDFTRNFRANAGHVPALARDDIDHAEEGVVAIETRTGTANDFHALNQVHVQREFRADESAVRKTVVQPMAIHQQKDPVIVISQVKTADAE